MRAMADEKKQRQEQIEEDAKEMARLHADINAHIKPKLVGAKPWPQPCRMSKSEGKQRLGGNVMCSASGFRMREPAAAALPQLRGLHSEAENF